MVAEPERRHLEVQEHCNKYLLTLDDLEKDCFQRQFFHFYNARTEVLRDRIIQNAKRIHGNEVVASRLEDVSSNETALVVGTIEKRQDSRPSVLKEMAEDEHKIPDEENEDTSGGFVATKNDFIEFEDDTQIVRLTGKIDMEKIATGCTVGLYGRQVKDNLFEVDDVIWPLPCPQEELPDNRPNETIAFLSGLNLSGTATDDMKTRTALNLMIRWLKGQGMGAMEVEKASRVSLLVVIGSSIEAPSQAVEMSSMARSITRDEPTPDIKALRLFDSTLTSISSSMEVIVIPGRGDPTPCLLPQQPIHKAALPLSSSSTSFRTLTNPADVTIEQIDFLLTDGENVNDVSTSMLEGARIILNAQHVCPTCPDTVDGFPFEGRDPLVIDRAFPHVMVVGNQTKGEAKEVELSSGEKSLVVGVPSFSQNPSLALLHLDTMKVEYKYFICG